MKGKGREAIKYIKFQLGIRKSGKQWWIRCGTASLGLLFQEKGNRLKFPIFNQKTTGHRSIKIGKK